MIPSSIYHLLAPQERSTILWSAPRRSARGRQFPRIVNWLFGLLHIPVNAYKMNWKSLAICLLCSSQICLAYNGMVMFMDDGMTLAVGNMLSYLHFTPGDTLWFLGWVSKSSGAMVGTCFALFMLAVIERWIVACRGVMEFHWSQQAIIIASDKLNTLPTRTPPIGFIKRFTPPFIPAHDISRGVMFVAQTLLDYLFMLTIMTFQLGFIFSLVVGLGVGETLFGRFGSVTRAH